MLVAEPSSSGVEHLDRENGSRCTINVDGGCGGRSVILLRVSGATKIDWNRCGVANMNMEVCGALLSCRLPMLRADLSQRLYTWTM